jgi:apolipoprotein N-acyltransferase
VFPGFVAARGRWLALAAGLPLPLSFAPFHVWWLAPVLLACLFLTWLDQPGRERFWRGFWFGFGAFATGTYWLYISIHDIGGAPPPFAILTMVALIALMALYHGICGWLAGRFPGAGNAGLLLLAFPAAWTLVEWLRGWLLSGFPWLSLGFGQLDGPLAPWAPVAGVHGVGLAVALVAGALALVLAGPGSGRRLAGLGVLALLAALTMVVTGLEWVRSDGRTLAVTLVQGGIGQERKWLPEELDDTLNLYRDLTVELQDQDLIIWPEAAVPALPQEVPDYLRAMGELARARDMQLLLGIVSYDPETDLFHNSLLALGEEEGVYHKRHLVPFGEYFPVPGFIRNMLRLMNLPYQDITPGLREQPLLMARGVPLAPSICYEDVFGAELRDFLPAAGMLVNISNDGWFGDSIAPHQHLQMARMRALETGRYMLRSTNTGISAIIAADGRVVARGPQFRPATVAGQVPVYEGSTPYVRLGNGPVVGVSLLLLAVSVLAGRRKLREQH